MSYEEELQQLHQQYAAISAQINALSQTVSPTNPYGTNPQQLKQLQSQQAVIHDRITFLQNQQKAQEQEQRVQQQYQQEADAFNQQLAEEKQQKQPQSSKTKNFFTQDRQVQDYGEFLDNELLSNQAKWDAKQKAKATQQAADDDAFFNSTGVYERYAGARRRLNSLNPIDRMWSDDNKFAREFEQRYKRKFGKDVDRNATDQFYNEYSMPNVATNLDNVAAKMKQLTEQWYGSQIDKMAEQYTADKAGGTMKEVEEEWNRALRIEATGSKQSIDDLPIPDLRNPNEFPNIDLWEQGPQAVYQWFREAFFDYYRVKTYTEWLQEMLNNGQFGTYQRTNDQMKQAQDILQNKAPMDMKECEQDIQDAAQEWNKLIQQVITIDTYKFNNVDWSDKGGGHGTGFKVTPQTTPTQPQGPRGYVPEYAR